MTMTITSLRQKLLRAAGRAKRTGGSRRARLGVRRLEERAVPATFTVNNTGDAGTGSGSTGDLRYCIGEANGASGSDTIEFDNGVFGSLVQTIALVNGELGITDAVAINGPGIGVVIDAGVGVNVSRIFSINTGGKVSLSRLDLVNGDATNGGGIYFGGSALELHNSQVKHNTASSDGGGIYSQGDVQIDFSSKIGGLSIDEGNDAGGSGGGLFVQSGTLNIHDSLVGFNGAVNNGGGIWAGDNSTTLDKADVKGNTAGLNGGGLWIGNGLLLKTRGNTAIGTGDDTTADQNIALKNGGGLYVQNTDVDMQDTYVFNNQAIEMNGGGMVLDGGNFSVLRCTVDKNVANKGNGGGIELMNGSLDLKESKVFTNYAVMHGGGIDAVGGTLTISQNSEIRDNAVFDSVNSKEGFGGGIHSAVNTSITASSIWEDNNAAYGGGIYLAGTKGTTATITGCNISKNLATYIATSGVDSSTGGGIYIASAGSVTINGCTIFNNTAGPFGGGIAVVGTCTVSVKNSAIGFRDDPYNFGNIAGNGAGIAVFKNGAKVTVDSCTIDSNTASNSGGGVYSVGGLKIFNSTISRNLAEGYDNNVPPQPTGGGGGIAYVQAGSPITVNSTIYGNESI